MGLLLVPAVLVVRRGPETHEYGDKYEDTAVIFKVGSTAIVKAWSGEAPSAADWKKLQRELRGYGITHVQWRRIRPDGKVHMVNRRIG